MNYFFLIIGIALTLMIFILLYRLVQGPSIIDRVTAINVLGTKTVILLIIIGQLYNRIDMFVDLALTYALLNFVTSLAMARFIRRRKDPGLKREAL